MAVAITRLSWWLWGGKEHEGTSVPSGSSLNNSISDIGLGLREADSVKFASVKGGKMHSTSRRRGKPKWNSREERRIDREYDVVLVPSDGGCLSGSESDDSDWSIGWMEPHAADFQSDDETESSFAVLVPCYGRGRREIVEGSNNHLFGVIGEITNGYSADGKKYMEQWLSSLQNN
ncbi:hypothetical protein ACHQM5_023678 [Ranunculus cassubicifolius]